MQPVKTARLIAEFGLEGDKHASAASKRQVLVADREALDAVGVTPGTIKENITVEGLDAMSLAIGSRLRLGESAIIEMTSICEPCFRMDEIREGLRLELVGRRGMLATVVASGAISVGDRITVEQQEALAS
jgi:MOSC domain-containing protein YiiM